MYSRDPTLDEKLFDVKVFCRTYCWFLVRIALLGLVISISYGATNKDFESNGRTGASRDELNNLADESEFQCFEDVFSDPKNSNPLDEFSTDLPILVESKPFQCLRILPSDSAIRSTKQLAVISIEEERKNQDMSPAKYNIPLHLIKTKRFLNKMHVVIRSNGKRYTAIERECQKMTAAGILSVATFAPDQLAGTLAYSEFENSGALRTISSGEFLAEKDSGTWHIADLTADSKSDPLFVGVDVKESSDRTFRDSKPKGYFALNRTLVVLQTNGSIESKVFSDANATGSVVFILDGGRSAFREHRLKAAGMALAASRPRIADRKCRQVN